MINNPLNPQSTQPAGPQANPTRLHFLMESWQPWLPTLVTALMLAATLTR